MKDTLIRARLSEDERHALAALCDGPCSAEGIANLLGLSHIIRANRLIGRAGHKIFDASPEESSVRNWHPKDWRGGWYEVVAPGLRCEVDKKFYWYIRPQIRKAFVEAGWYALAGKKEKATQTYQPRLEGAEVLRLLSIRERDPDLRAACLAVHGHRCFVCGNDLGVIYGEIGKGFIHVHHLHPLAERKGAVTTDPKKDLIPVCPNCHSIIHRGGGTRTPEEVRTHLRKAKTALQRATCLSGR